jgi:hypothetical protein
MHFLAWLKPEEGVEDPDAFGGSSDHPTSFAS